MTIGIAENVIDEITVEGNTFPVGGVLGFFYQNSAGEYTCAGSVIWDYQSNVIPVWSSDDLLDGQTLTMFAFAGPCKACLKRKDKGLGSFGIYKSVPYNHIGQNGF